MFFLSKLRLVFFAVAISFWPPSCSTIFSKPTKVESPRRSVTFVIGSDKSSNKYYTFAAKYFRQHPSGKNQKVIIQPLSLTEILEYLNSLPKGEKWDRVNVVSHGNSWTGLAVPLYPKGPRTMIEPLVEAQQKGRLPVLKNDIFDSNSMIVFYACGLGDDMPLLRKLKEVFSSNVSPQICSTKLFNIFSAGKSTSKHSLAYFYNSFYKPGHNPGRKALARQLEQRYPDVNIDWFDALGRQLPAFEGQPFSYKYHIPISWTEVYLDGEKIPRLQSEDDIVNWIMNMPDFLNLINEYGIPLDKYKWSVRYFNYTNEAGEVKRAMKIKGRTTVMSVLKQLIDPVTGKTFVPDLSDSSFFTTL